MRRTLRCLAALCVALSGCAKRSIIAGPELIPAGKVRVEREAASLACRPAGVTELAELSATKIHCDYAFAARFSNPSQEPVVLAAVLLTGEQHPGGVRRSDEPPPPTVPFELAGEAVGVLEERGYFGTSEHWTSTFEPAVVRHPILSSRLYERTYELGFALSHEARAPSYELALDLEHPTTWHPRVAATPTSAPALVELVGPRRGARTATHAVTSMRSTMEGSTRVHIDMVAEGDLFNAGGPVLALGVSGVRGSSARFLAQLGYELAVTGAFVVAAQAETDFDTRVALAAVTELATPWTFDYDPSFGIGAGLAVQLAPEVTPGVRIQATIAYPYLGVSAMADYYPETKERVLGLVGRVSL